MLKKTEAWSVRHLEELHPTIEFPEYQREPNVWSRAAKQRLIDSILRQFDIASLYIYDNRDGSLDCIDGRQRIGAIMAFLGKNPSDEDNGLTLKTQNEIYDDDADSRPFGALDGKSYREIVEHAKGSDTLALTATAFVQAFTDYQLTIVKLSDSKRPEEFNLQFTRLNLGTIINSGEKLHAMVGEMRDACFAAGGIGQHPFLTEVKMPTRRYSKEQVAAQILAQVFSFKETEGYTRTRHFDLQRLFKEHSRLTLEQRKWIEDVTETMGVLNSAFEGRDILRNKAMTLSTVLLAWKRKITTQRDAVAYREFVAEFLCRLRWQLRKGLDVDKEYRYLTDFQRHITQASVEKSAVESREATLNEEYERWTNTTELKGDAEFRQASGLDPARACRSTGQEGAL